AQPPRKRAQLGRVLRLRPQGVGGRTSVAHSLPDCFGLLKRKRPARGAGREFGTMTLLHASPVGSSMNFSREKVRVLGRLDIDDKTGSTGTLAPIAPTSDGYDKSSGGTRIIGATDKYVISLHARRVAACYLVWSKGLAADERRERLPQDGGRM